MLKKIVGILLIVISLAGGYLFFKSFNEDKVLIDYNNPVQMVTKKEILELKAGMTYEEILEELGPTKDIGSGLYVATYAVKEGGVLYLSFANLESVNELDGSELYESKVR